MGISDREALIRRLGDRAGDPLAATAVVGAAALVFSGLYYGGLLVSNAGEIAAGDYSILGEMAVMFSLTVSNAVAVTWLVWSRLDLDGVWSYKRGAGAGLLVGLASHLGLGLVLGAWFAIRDLVGLGTTVDALGTMHHLTTVAIVAVFSVVYTAGVPILLSVAVGLGLTYCRKRVAG